MTVFKKTTMTLCVIAAGTPIESAFTRAIMDCHRSAPWFNVQTLEFDSQMDAYKDLLKTLSIYSS